MALLWKNRFILDNGIKKRIDRLEPMHDCNVMSGATIIIKSELRDIGDRIPASASYSDAMYQLYVRMKIAKGKQAANEGRVIPHDEAKLRFAG